MVGVIIHVLCVPQDMRTGGRDKRFLKKMNLLDLKITLKIVQNMDYE